MKTQTGIKHPAPASEETAGGKNSGKAFLGILVIMFLLACLSVSCGRKKEEAPEKEIVRPVKTMTVSAATEGMDREFPGKVRANQRVDLAFKVAGPLIKLPVKEGIFVKKGQVIAQILPRDFKTALAEAKANELEARQQHQRYKDLYIKKQVSKADFDKTKRAFDVARSKVADAENALDDTYLRAPFSGIIARKYVDNYQDVQAKEPIVSLQDVSILEVLVDVPENTMVQLREEHKGSRIAEAEFSAAPGKKFELTLKEFSTEADPQTQTYRVVLQMPAPQGLNILPGMTATVTGTVIKYDDEVATGFYVPVNAVFADKSAKSFVWLVTAETMTVTKKEVRIGNVKGGEINITDGLKSGDTIVVAGVNYLQPGMKVRDIKNQ